MRVAGIMSGTSLDGVDVAIVDIRGAKFKTVAVHSSPYPKAVRQSLLEISNAVSHIGNVSRLNFLLGEIYAGRFSLCCRKNNIDPKTVKLIGCHGQTVYHEGGGKTRNTLQIGEAAVLAERTGIDVVSNFRERDIAVGGKGAPLVPLFDFLLFRHARRGRIALNLGGIANISAIPAGASTGDVTAFDTGPANMVIDQLVQRRSNGRLAFDRGGAIGKTGRIDEGLLARLMRDAYFRQIPPKTAGREQYGAGFVDRLIATELPLPDLIATATALTARSVALAIEQTSKRTGGVYHDLIVGGGGAKNAFLMHLLAEYTNLTVVTTTEFGIDSDFKEAIAFALLAHRTVRGEPGNVPTATGASRAVTLGKITRA